MNKDNYIVQNNIIKYKNEKGFYELEHDKKAIEYFQKEVDEKMFKLTDLKKLEYLIENDYYIDFFKIYLKKDIQNFYDKAYSYKFKFSNFMGISLFYKNYSLKNHDKSIIFESYEDRSVCVAMYIANGDVNLVYDIINVLLTQQFQPATPTFSNAGLKNNGQLVSCFLLDIDDSLNSINYNLITSMQLSKLGGGVALNLSKVRSLNESVKNVSGVSKGVVPIMKLLEDSFNYVDQLGKRPGAGAVYLNIFHADVIDFLDTKKINADEKSRIQTLSIGLLIPDVFMKLLKNDEDMFFFYPKNVYDEYNVHLDEMDLNIMYKELINNPQIKKKKYNTRQLMQNIAITQFESGYPYLIFIDNANNNNPLKKSGKIKMSNLCTEIFQNQSTSIINDYNQTDIINNDVSCILGSLNIINLIENNDIEKTINTAMRLLSNVSETLNINNAPGINKANSELHSIGLGAMNLHGFLSKNHIFYESDEAIKFVDILFNIINFYSIKSSMNIALEKNKSFEGFEKSEYFSGEYFKKYIEDEIIIKNEHIKQIFENIYIPTIKDWKKLSADVHEHGMYNAYRIAIAPTQSISYINNSTASILPVVDLIETRMYGESITYYPMPFLDEKNMWYYKSAYNMNQLKIIDLISTIQKHVDQGISSVLFMTNENSTKDLVRLYYYAWIKGLKSIYYVRTKNLNIEECESCSI